MATSGQSFANRRVEVTDNGQQCRGQPIQIDRVTTFSGDVDAVWHAAQLALLSFTRRRVDDRDWSDRTAASDMNAIAQRECAVNSTTTDAGR